MGIEALKTIGVLGAGQMGGGIAQVVAQGGRRVLLADLDLARAERGRDLVAKGLAKLVEKGKLDAPSRDAALARIVPVAGMEAFAEADFAIEAATENLELKRKLMRGLDQACREGVTIASNTSSISITLLAAETSRPQHVVGMHFMNPVPVMKLVEVVRHPGSDPAAVALAVALADKLGKTPIVVADAPGFASSRLGLALGLEAMRMVEQGVASAADIDTAMKLGYGHPMGPLELTDLVGLDVRLGIADYLTSAIGPAFAPPEILRAKVADGKLGKKSGEGFYTWTADGKKR